MEASWQESRGAFADAARWFVDTVAGVDDRWDRPGLGEWDLRALVGHTSRSLLTVEEYLGRPAAAVEVPSAADYVRRTRALAAQPAVAARGVAAGEALGEDPAVAVAGLARRVCALVDSREPGALVTTVAGGMRLGEYLPTRTFELVVHTADLSVALGTAPDVPPRAAALALRLLSEVAVADGLAGPLLLVATGRPSFPGFSVL